MPVVEPPQPLTPWRRERVVGVGIVALALAAMAALIAVFWQPAPPKVVVMSTGAVDGAYHAYAQQYQRILARSGVELRLLPSSGALQNLQRLRSGEGGVSLALVQGGTVHGEADLEQLVSLGGMFFEALWVFCRCEHADAQPSELGSMRVAVGAPGSGTQQLASLLLEQIAPEAERPVPVELGGLAAARALAAGEVQAAMFVTAPDAPAVQLLLREPGIHLLGFRRAEALARRYPFLTPLELPEGAFDLGRNIPPARVQLLALTASLAARTDLHPVIVDLLLGAAREVHGRGSMLWRPGDFPSSDAPELPLSSDAERFNKSGPSVLQRYLPFWAVVWIQRLLFLGLPILAIGIPLLRYMPMLYRWGMRRRIYRWYGELSYIERALERGQGDHAAFARRLDSIEHHVSGMRVPPAFASEAYMLKMHLQMVRSRLPQPAGTAT
jgi:TRAP-type uncharacterized transport system substrate-binding protein